MQLFSTKFLYMTSYKKYMY